MEGAAVFSSDLLAIYTAEDDGYSIAATLYVMINVNSAAGKSDTGSLPSCICSGIGSRFVEPWAFAA